MSDSHELPSNGNRPAQNSRRATPGEALNASHNAPSGGDDFLGLNSEFGAATPPPAPAPAPEFEAQPGESWLAEIADVHTEPPEVTAEVRVHDVAEEAPQDDATPPNVLNTSWQEPPRSKRARRWILPVAGGAVVVSVALIGLPLLRRDAPPSNTSSNVASNSTPTLAQPTPQAPPKVDPDAASLAAIEALEPPSTGAATPSGSLDEPDPLTPPSDPGYAIPLLPSGDRALATPREESSRSTKSALEENGLVEVVDPGARTTTVPPIAAQRTDTIPLISTSSGQSDSTTFDASDVGPEEGYIEPSDDGDEPNSEEHIGGMSADASSACDDDLAMLGIFEPLPFPEPIVPEVIAHDEDVVAAAVEPVDEEDALAAALEPVEPSFSTAVVEPEAEAREPVAAPVPEPVVAAKVEPMSAPEPEPAPLAFDPISAEPEECVEVYYTGLEPDAAELEALESLYAASPEALALAASQPVVGCETLTSTKAAPAAVEVLHFVPGSEPESTPAPEVEVAVATVEVTPDPAYRAPLPTVEPDPVQLARATPPAAPAPQAAFVGAPLPQANATSPRADVVGPEVAPGSVVAVSLPVAPSQASRAERMTELGVEEVLRIDRATDDLKPAAPKAFKGIWQESRVPVEAIDQKPKLVTPNVGQVRALLVTGEIFEGNLQAVGEGCYWIDTKLGRMGLQGTRVKSIAPLENGGDKTAKGAAKSQDGERVSVKTKSGVVHGTVLAREGTRITVSTDDGLRLTVDAADIQPLVEAPQVQVKGH